MKNSELERTVGIPNTAHIEHKRNVLRRGTEEMTVNVPMDIRQKMMQKNAYYVDKEQMEMDLDTQAKAEQFYAEIQVMEVKIQCPVRWYLHLYFFCLLYMFVYTFGFARQYHHHSAASLL
eukprot:607663_1